MAFFSALGRGAASVMSISVATVMLEEFLEAVAESFTILFYLFNNFLDFQQVVLMFDFFFSNFSNLVCFLQECRGINTKVESFRTSPDRISF